MTLDIAMGGSTNTVLHLLAAAHEGEVDFTMADIDRLSRRVPVPVQGRAGQGRRPHGGRPPRRRHHGDPRRARPRRADRHRGRPTVHAADAGRRARPLGRARAPTATTVARLLPGRARRRADADRLQPGPPLGRARPRPRGRRHPRRRARLLQGRRPRRALRQPRRRRLHREDRRRRRLDPELHRPGARLREPGRGGRRHPRRQGRSRATWSSSATRARAAARACRRCSIRRAI